MDLEIVPICRASPLSRYTIKQLLRNGIISYYRYFVLTHNEGGKRLGKRGKFGQGGGMVGKVWKEVRSGKGN